MIRAVVRCAILADVIAAVGAAVAAFPNVTIGVAAACIHMEASDYRTYSASHAEAAAAALVAVLFVKIFAWAGIAGAGAASPLLAAAVAFGAVKGMAAVAAANAYRDELAADVRSHAAASVATAERPAKERARRSKLEQALWKLR